MRGAIEHGNARLGHVHQARAINKRGNACEIGKRTFARGKVINGEHGVGLAAAKGGLKLYDRLPTLNETLGHLRQRWPCPR